MEWYGPAGAPLTGLPRFEAFRLRFQVSNRDTRDVQWKPRLEWSSEPDQGFQPLPGDVTAAPLRVFDAPTIRNGDPIEVSQLALGSGQGKSERGRVFDETDDALAVTLGRGAYTEIEFSLRATATAAWNTTYYLRLTDAATPVSGTSVAKLTMGERPPVILSEAQYTGVRVADLADAGAGAALAARTATRATAQTTDILAAAQTFVIPHSGYSATADQCADCHRTHTGQNKKFLKGPEPQANTCFSCHDGTGAKANIAAQYADPNVPANDPTTSAFYQHPATALVSGHTRSGDEEFKGVLNRHAECADCHNPHQVDPTIFGTMTPAGWTASGAQRGITGVGVTNGAAGSAPTFTWKTPITYEYELCFKCHSSYTVLRSYTTPTYQKQDKAAELNPANAAYHPVEAAGRSSSTQLNNSLAGSSPYKLWIFTTGQQVRCLNCHGNYRLANPASPPAPNARLAPHTSRNRSLLMNNYKSRTLNSKGTDFNAANFALCLQCHAVGPFADRSGDPRPDTNFNKHGFHLGHIDGKGEGGLDINVPGAGQGNAVCAECHFRMHSTAFAYHPNQQNNPRMVNFGPQATGPSGTGSPVWDGTNRTCSLRCHGETHVNRPYGN